MKGIAKPICVLLSLILILSAFAVLPVTAAPAVLATGEVGAQGDNVIWTITDDDVLTLSGTGATADYSTSPGWNDPGRHGPWWYSEYADRVKTVVVEEGITYLGKCLLEGDASLTSAELPDSLEGLRQRRRSAPLYLHPLRQSDRPRRQRDGHHSGSRHRRSRLERGMDVDAGLYRLRRLHMLCMRTGKDP